MAKRVRKKGIAPETGKLNVDDYRHESEKRKNNPPAKIAAEGLVPILPKAQYYYSPRLSPVLRFDPSGASDKLPELLEEATQRPLTQAEAKILAEAIRKHEAWVEWSGKREAKKFEVDPVALHIHERIAAQAIVKVAARQDVQRDLFADPELEYHKAVQFYQHDIDWTNRLILGDSLHVMSSLAKREDLAGKVQMIYIDPPYGIRFKSNFQPQVGNREVSDADHDLTREPETVKAYRDTWHLGIHSYLSYLRDRLIVAKELLTDSGSIFVQIGDENVHSVRALLEEVFGSSNHVATIVYKTSIGMGGSLLDGVYDHVLWFAKDKNKIFYRQLYSELEVGEEGASRYKQVRSMNTGEQRLMTESERADPSSFPQEWHPYIDQGLTSRSGSTTTLVPFTLQGRDFRPTSGGWRTNLTGLIRLAKAERLMLAGNSIRYRKYFHDSPALALTNFWTDTGGGITSRSDPKVYAVQTTNRIIERCLLMTTDPGDLVLDPTCGSGTTAYVAEQWGRRWITIDTSRVAIAIARQRLLTSKYEYYDLADKKRGVSGGFVYKTVPHITLGSIAQNTNLDPIFAKHEPILDKGLAACNEALERVSPELRKELLTKLAEKQRREGKKSIDDADRRRWQLPEEKWEHWEVPFDTDPDYRPGLSEAITEYRNAWRAKMDEINSCIEANAKQEELVDQPTVVKAVVRVSGPFTVEAVQPPELSLGDIVSRSDEGKFDGDPEELEETFQATDEPVYVTRFVESRAEQESKNLEAYLDQMIRLLRMDGVRFPDNRQMQFVRLDPITGDDSGLHAEGRWVPEGGQDTDPEGRAKVCVGFGPQFGPVTSKQVQELIRAAYIRGYDDLVAAGFSFDGPAQTDIEGAQHPKLRIHMAHIRPDVNPAMNGLLKEQPGSQLFTVFGQPRTRVDGPDQDGNYTVTMEGVDIYNPVDNSITPTGADKVAAWFIDGDYDGCTFCITQAFFPDRSAWDKLSRALRSVIDPEAFDTFSGTVSVGFPAGKHRCAAVKVIDPRGNEVMRVHKL